jgi:hypothetical protein
MRETEFLVDKKRLLEMYPAFTKWGLKWFTSTRRIPLEDFENMIEKIRCKKTNKKEVLE